jgi:hypothetical protein
VTAAAKKDATDTLRCHPVMAEFGRAKATLWLLDQILTGELSFLDQPGRRLPTWISTPLPGLERAEVQGWLLDICAKVLVDCLATAEAEFIKTAAPAAEAAR